MLPWSAWQFIDGAGLQFTELSHLCLLSAGVKGVHHMPSLNLSTLPSTRKVTSPFVVKTDELPVPSRAYAYQSHVNSELNTNAYGGHKDHHGDGTQFDAQESHDTKELHSHHRQDQHLRRAGLTQGSWQDRAGPVATGVSLTPPCAYSL